MTELAVRVQNLGKKYRIGGKPASYRTLRETLTQKMLGPVRAVRSRLARRANPAIEQEAFWALRDVSFEVKRGEVVGVIGRNGAGKSTLLKILSRITEPSAGAADVYGRVGSLLEVGTGFHPELSGRENVYLNGAILGMKRAEIQRNFAAIVEFAEVERFIDTPVKHYSSGMYLRLAFAVAAHLEPEIILVDEVLAVGDASFQKKCIRKMNSVANEGRTVLFVSHDMTNVSVLCGSVLLLDQGRVKMMGPADDVIASYIQQGASACSGVSWDLLAAPGDDLVRITALRVCKEDQTETDSFALPEPVKIVVEFAVLDDDARLNPVFIVKNAFGTAVFSTANYEERAWGKRAFARGGYVAACTLPGHILNDGEYSVDALVVHDMRRVRAAAEKAISFKVHDDGSTRGDYVGPWAGIVRPRCSWQTEALECVGVQG